MGPSPREDGELAVKPIPDRYHTVTPYLTVSDLHTPEELARRAQARSG